MTDLGVGDRIAMLYEGRFIVQTTPDELPEIDNETVMRFVQGRASPEELAELQQGRWNARDDGDQTAGSEETS